MVLSIMKDLEYMICPENHYVPYTRENLARDFSDRDIDAMNLQPMFELGLYCFQCNRVCGLSKLEEPKVE